jgi:hypothetical protein
MTTRSAYAAATPATPAFALEPLSPSTGTRPSGPSPTHASADADAGSDDFSDTPAHAFIPSPAAQTKRPWRRTHRSRLSAAFSAASARVAGLAQIGDRDPLAPAVREFVRSNAGLLLIALSQAFFAFMNVSVKVLNGLDPPVAALEVRRPPRLLTAYVDADDVYRCSQQLIFIRMVRRPPEWAEQRSR